MGAARAATLTEAERRLVRARRKLTRAESAWCAVRFLPDLAVFLPLLNEMAQARDAYFRAERAAAVERTRAGR